MIALGYRLHLMIVRDDLIVLLDLLLLGLERILLLLILVLIDQIALRLLDVKLVRKISALHPWLLRTWNV